MDDPIDFFSDDENSNQKVKLLSENVEAALKWEAVKCSVVSPEIVQNKEILARQIFSPIHIDSETNELNTLALDDVFNKGLSTNRTKYISDLALHKAGEKKARKDNLRLEEANRFPNREYVGLVHANVTDIRNIVDGIERIFTIYDTALTDQLDHADICCIKPNITGMPKKASRIFRRKQLLDKFGKLKKRYF